MIVIAGRGLLAIRVCMYSEFSVHDLPSSVISKLSNFPLKRLLFGDSVRLVKGFLFWYIIAQEINESPAPRIRNKMPIINRVIPLAFEVILTESPIPPTLGVSTV